MTPGGVTVAIRGDEIRLGQFLKLADAVDQGGDVKALLATRAVSVNGEIETRRGRQLHVGDTVGVGYVAYTVTAPTPTPAEEPGSSVEEPGSSQD